MRRWGRMRPMLEMGIYMPSVDARSCRKLPSFSDCTWYGLKGIDTTQNTPLPMHVVLLLLFGNVELLHNCRKTPPIAEEPARMQRNAFWRIFDTDPQRSTILQISSSHTSKQWTCSIVVVREEASLLTMLQANPVSSSSSISHLKRIEWSSTWVTRMNTHKASNNSSSTNLPFLITREWNELRVINIFKVIKSQ